MSVERPNTAIVIAALAGMKSDLEEHFGVTSAVGVSDAHSLADVAALLREARAALAYRLVKGGSDPIRFTGRRHHRAGIPLPPRRRDPADQLDQGRKRRRRRRDTGIDLRRQLCAAAAVDRDGTLSDVRFDLDHDQDDGLVARRRRRCRIVGAHRAGGAPHRLPLPGATAAGDEDDPHRGMPARARPAHVALPSTCGRRSSSTSRSHCYERNLGPEAVADHVQRNSAYIGRFFREQFGVGISSYIKNLRVARAKRRPDFDRRPGPDQ